MAVACRAYGRASSSLPLTCRAQASASAVCTVCRRDHSARAARRAVARSPWSAAASAVSRSALTPLARAMAVQASTSAYWSPAFAVSPVPAPVLVQLAELDERPGQRVAGDDELHALDGRRLVPARRLGAGAALQGGEVVLVGGEGAGVVGEGCA